MAGDKSINDKESGTGKMMGTRDVLNDKEKKRILVALPTFYPSKDANTQCAMRILSESKSFCYTVFMEKEDELSDIEKINGIEIIRYPKRSIRKDISDGNIRGLVTCFIRYIFAKVKSKFFWGDVNFSRVYNFIMEYQRFINIDDYSAVIGFINPIESLLMVAYIKEKHDIPAQVMYFDPFFSNETKSEKGFWRRKRIEEKALRRLDKVLVTSYVKRDFCKYRLNVDSSKVMINELPGIRPIIQPSRVVISEDRNIIKCFFIGNLYWNIRNPISLIKAFSQIPYNVHLYFVGGCFDGEISELLEKENVRLSNNVHFLGSVSPEKAEEYLGTADVLVNIGNSVSNQVPSKIFDYMSIGKPILCIIKNDEDPSLEYLDKYPLCLCINEKELNTDYGLHLVIDFLENNGNGERVAYDVVSKTMPELTVERVRGIFENCLSDITL